MTLLAKLSDGPRSYTDLLNGHGKEQLDGLIQWHINRGEIVRVPRGDGHWYGLRAEVPEDKPIVATIKRIAQVYFCQYCGDQNPGKNQVFCGKVCQMKFSQERRGFCPCGAALKKGQRRYCCPEHQYKSYIGKHPLAEVKRKCEECGDSHYLTSFPRVKNTYLRVCQKCKTKKFELQRERNRHHSGQSW